MGHTSTQAWHPMGHMPMHCALQGPQDGTCTNHIQHPPQVHVHTAWYSHAKVPTLGICWSKYTPRAESQDQLRPQTPEKPAQPKARGAGALQAKGERGKGLSEEGLGNPAQNRDSPTQCSATIQRGLKG